MWICPIFLRICLLLLFFLCPQMSDEMNVMKEHHLVSKSKVFPITGHEGPKGE
jgi:hypothetical protein